MNVKMPTIVGILTFISMINTAFEWFKVLETFIIQRFNFYEQLKCLTELSTKTFITSSTAIDTFEYPQQIFGYEKNTHFYP